MRVMVLGGSSNQIDLIKKAKAQGDHVLLVDYLPDCMGKAYADEHVLVSTFDIDAIIEVAKIHKIEAIVSSGTDQPIYSAAVVSAQLGLNFYADEKLAKAVTNKREMKALFKANGIPTVDYRLIKRGFKQSKLDGLKYPVVLKPIDSQGQRGIFLLNSAKEVDEHLEKALAFSRQDEALVESFYKNDEITVNGWVKNGKLTIISVVDRVTIKQDHHIGICLCHNYPSVHLDKFSADIDRITSDIVVAFGIQNGPIYFQYLVGEDGIKVNEIAMRVGGAYEGITIPIIADMDILKMTLDIVKTGTVDEPKLTTFNYLSNTTYVSTQLFFCKPDKIAGITPLEEIKALPYVKAVCMMFKVGQTIPKIENATARAGYFVVTGTSFKNMIDHVNSVFESFRIWNKHGGNMMITYNMYHDKYLFNNQ